MEKTIYNNKIICLAKNYLKPGENIGINPVLFDKPWTSIVKEPNCVKLINNGHHIEYELELGFIISKTAKNINKEDYINYIDGYFICIDISDRTLQKESKEKGQPWFISKGQDYFLPISKPISSKFIENPHNLVISLFINDELKQSDNTKNMHFKISEQLEYISKYITLHPGDLIITGTPSGIGPLKIGDKIYANLKQNDEVLIEMIFNVEESFISKF